MALGFSFVKAGPVKAEEGAGIPLVKFEGTIETIVDGVWTIDEQAVTVTKTTIIVETEGKAVVGAQVVVIAKKGAADALEAILIRVKPAETTRVVYLPGQVTDYTAGAQVVIKGVAGDKTVKINSGTQIEGTIKADEFVLIKAKFDGSDYTALTIKVVEKTMQRIVEFDVIVTKIDTAAKEWTVGDRVVKIDEHTIIQGTIVVGNRVKVRAYKSGDSLVALLIKKAGAAWWPKMERFSGEITDLPAAPYIGTWKIGERTVTVTAFTRIRGVPVKGATAHVTAWTFTTDDKCVAMEIKIEGEEGDEITISGTIKELPKDGLWGTWIITEESEEAQALADQEILVLPGTWIEGLPKVGDAVKVEAIKNADGVIVAKKIELQGDDEPYEGIHLMGKITEVAEEYIVVRPVIPFGTIKIGITEDTVVTGGPLAVDQCVTVRAKGTGHQQYEAIEITVVDCPTADAAGKVVVRTAD